LLKGDIYWAAKADINEKLLELSLKHQVLSEKTAFLCIRERKDPNVDLDNKQKIK